MDIRHSILAVTMMLSLTAPGLRADEGHSGHAAGEELGAVHFPTSCVKAVQPGFDRAVAFLYSFGYAAAREGFESVAQRDTECGMAWWGVAMTYYHPIWAPPTPEDLAAGRTAADKAASVGAKSERERGYIAAIGRFYADADHLDHRARSEAYRAALEDLSRRFADDDEAKIFYALSLLGTAPPRDAELTQQKQAAAILNGLLAKHPRHPGIAHYLIHSFDYPGLAPLALPAARAYAKIAPASPHAQHMPSHIFTRLGLWRESIAANLKSEASADAGIAKSHPGAAAFDALHALDYLVYGYLQIGDDAKAKQALGRVLRSQTFDEPEPAAGYAVAAAPARYALERHAWAEAAQLPIPGAILPWERFPFALANLHFARAIGGARSGNLALSRQELAELAAVRKTLAESPPAGPYDWAGQVESLRLAAAGSIAQAEGHSDEALSLLRQAADLQDQVGKHPITPGEVLPARELLADLLLGLGRNQEALTEYEADLVKIPNRLNALAGALRSAEAAGDTAKIATLRAQLTAQCVRDTPRSEIGALLTAPMASVSGRRAVPASDQGTR